MTDAPSAAVDTDDHAAFEARYQAALSTLPFRAGIYLPTDRISPAQRAAGLERVAYIHNHALEADYRDQLRALREKHIGQRRAFIIGNGPSLNRTDLSQLKDEVTFCVNGFFLKMPELSWTPTYYVVEDHLVAEDRADAINALRGPTKLFPTYLAYCLDPGEDTIFFNHRARKSFPDGFDFSTDAAKITYTGCTVTFTCMQLAHYMGFQELHLIGVDASYDIPKDVQVDTSHGTAVLDMASADPNHFHPDYFGKGMRWHDPQVDKMLEAYAEARRVTDQLGRPIYNATVGGALELFERRAFGRTFPGAVAPGRMADINDLDEASARATALSEAKSAAETRSLQQWPRVLVLDVIPPGQMTATGELKSTLFGQWPDDRVLQIALDKHRITAIGGGLSAGATATAELDDDTLQTVIDAFAPQLVLFRPVPDRDGFNTLAFGLIERLSAPLALWIVDDWPAHLAETDPEQFARLEPQFRRAVAKADLCLAISEPMAEAFEARYGKPFAVFSNAVDPVDWPEPAPTPRGGPFRIRYSGGLSSNMSLQSALDLAEAVEALEVDQPVLFEINTRDHWAEAFADRFKRFKRTVLTTQAFDTPSYRSWLQAADLTAVLYNFDPETLDYVRYSMANKTVECLASGAPTLAYGPEGIHTLDFLENAGVAKRVKVRSAEALGDALRTAIDGRHSLRAAGESARQFVFEARDLATEQDRFRKALAGVAREGCEPGDRAIIAQLNRDYRALVLNSLNNGAQHRGPVPTGLEARLNQQGLRTHPHEPPLLPPAKSRLSRMVWYYRSWRGLLAAIATLLPILGVILQWLAAGSTASVGGVLAAAATSGSLAVVFFFFAYHFSLIEDYSPQGRQRF